jgi:molybdopterin-guanine dinucleotide biosynthesis protein A
MGRDKALLPFRGGSLATHGAAIVTEAAGSAAFIGDPVKYGHLGYPVFADQYPGEGPLGGIATALGVTTADWNLVLACDMPAITAEVLSEVLSEAEGCGADVVMPCGRSGRWEPLGAVYHRRCLPTLTRALASGVRKITDGLGELAIARYAVNDDSWFQNLNTPGEWAGYHDAG